MLAQERSESLLRKHSMLASLIEKEENQPLVNDVYVRQLKRQKLVIKEVLSGVRQDGTE